MKLAHLCFVIAGVSALSAASLSLAQVTYPNEWCFSTPRSACQNLCGCPIENTPTDFCSGGLPPNGQDTFPSFTALPPVLISRVYPPRPTAAVRS